MPFTPFHLGIGAAIKAAPRHFSFTVFTCAQILTDTEVLFHMANGDARLHQHLHTPVGAIAVGAVSFILARPLCERFLRWWRVAKMPLKEFFDPTPEISRLAAFSGAFVGTFSHLVIDAIMHPEVRPLFPWTEENFLFGAVGPGALHLLCFLMGAVGAVICATWRRSAL